MGRKTWDSMPAKIKKTGLPGRGNIIVTVSPSKFDYLAPAGIVAVGSIIQAIEYATQMQKYQGDVTPAYHGPIWIIGGGEIYGLAIEAKLVHSIDFTLVPSCDTSIGQVVKLRTDKLLDGFGLIGEEQNTNDARLTHRLYTLGARETETSRLAFLEIVKEEGKKINLELNDENAMALLYAVTGYPSFWVSEYGNTPLACARAQLKEHFNSLVSLNETK